MWCWLHFIETFPFKWYWKSRSFTWKTNLKNTKHCEENNRLYLSLSRTHTYSFTHSHTHNRRNGSHLRWMKERAWNFCIPTMVPTLTDLCDGWKYSKDFLWLVYSYQFSCSCCNRCQLVNLCYDWNWNNTNSFFTIGFCSFYFNLYINILA